MVLETAAKARLGLSVRITGQSPQTVDGGRENAPRCAVCSTRSKCLLARVSPAVAERLQGFIVEVPVPVGGCVETQGQTAAHLTLIKLGYFKAERSGVGGLSSRESGGAGAGSVAMPACSNSPRSCP